MMSSNGNAIRQLYQDINNVADYLTKPFAPNVLKAVVGHILQKEKPAETPAPTQTIPAVEAGPATASVTASVTASAAEPAMPKEFMDQVARLLHLMEKNPQAASAAAKQEGTGDASAPARATVRKRRVRKVVASAPTPDAVVKKFRRALQKFLRTQAGRIPVWESSRGTEEAEEYFLQHLLPKDVLRDLSQELLKAAGVPPESAGALRCPANLVPLDAVMLHLQSTRATGELRIEMSEETVLVCFDNGRVALVTSNDPRHYCGGAACDFQAVPHAVIGDAVRAQEEHSVPFFMSLDAAGYLPPGASLDDLLVSQAERCLLRGFKFPGAVMTFYPLLRLPAMVRSCKLNLSLNQLLLACYRSVDDWFTLEKAFPTWKSCSRPPRKPMNTLGNSNSTPMSSAC